MDILVGKSDGVLTIEFNRPDKKNSITSAMYQRLGDALQEAESDPDVRVILLHGKEDAFTAGNDLEDFMKHPPQGTDTPVFRFVYALSSAKKPVVAAVTGVAIGIGTTLLFHCDLVYAGENAKFNMPFASLGLVPESGSSYLLPMIAGYQRAAELFMLAEPFDAAKAKEIGFVSNVLPVAETLPAARKAAARIATLPGKSIRTTKALLKRPYAERLEEQMRLEGEHFRTMLLEPAAKEAFSAFFERRKPDFSRLN